MKLKSAKLAPCLRARTIWKSKSLKTEGARALLEVEVAKICTTPARESDLEAKIVKNWQRRSTMEHFWKLKSAKFAPRLRARAIWKSKSSKHQGLGPFFEVKSGFRVEGAGISTRRKMRGRRRSLWGLQKRWQAWGIRRGSETMRFAWQAQGFRALRCRCLKPPTQNPWKGCKFHVTEVLLCSDDFAWQLQEFVCLGSTFPWQAQYFCSVHLKIVKTYCNSEVKCPVNMSFLKEVEMLRFWSSKLHFWRKSRTKASVLNFKASFLKEVSQKCFAFDLQSFMFEGSLAQKLRFWASKLRFWRKSRRNASFLSFQSFVFEGSLAQKFRFWSSKLHFLKEVSQKCFVFELQSFIFEGSLAEKLRFWASKLRFWRKSRRKASFLTFKASFLKEVSQKCFAFDLKSFFFEGSLAQKLRFWASKLRFWKKSRRYASFLIFRGAFFKEFSHKSFVFELQSFIFEGSLAEMLCFWASKLRFWRKVSQNSFSQSVSQSVS